VFDAQVGGELSKEGPVDGHCTFPASLADHSNLAATLVDIGEAQ
jgi:hypothetical protein